MDAVRTKAKILVDLLRKKQEALTIIYNITMNRKELQSTQSAQEIASYLMEMNKEKQVQIDKVMELDEMFQNFYTKIGVALEENARQYQEEIRQLQQYIQQITDLDLRIRLEENKESTPQSKIERVPFSATTKNQLVAAYKENSNFKGLRNARKVT